MKTTLIIVLGVYGTWLLLLKLFEEKLIFPVFAMGDAPAAPTGVDRLIRPLGDGQSVEAFWLPQPGKAPLVLLFHGNGELIDYNLQDATAWYRRGFHVLVPEYRGYGRSGGQPGQQVILEDNLWFLGEVMKDSRVRDQPLLYYGRSLGGGVACDLARQKPPRGLILESTFRSIKAMALRYGAPPFLIRNPFDNEAWLGQTELPVLVIHGKRDEVIPFAHGEALGKLGPRTEFHSFDAGHNDLPRDSRYQAILDKWLAGIFPGAAL